MNSERNEGMGGQTTPVTPGTSISGVAAAILVLLFFTPWFSACGSDLSGFDLAAGTYANGTYEESAWWLFGVPVVGVAVIAIAIRNLNQPLVSVARRARYVLALSTYPLLCITLLYGRLRASSSGALIDLQYMIRFEFGFYGTLLAAVGMMAGGVLDWAAGRVPMSLPGMAVAGSLRSANSTVSRPPPVALPRPRAWLQGETGGFALQALELTQDVTRVGSGAGCEACLREPNAAEVHAVVRFARGQYYLQDQGNPIGTLLNGQRVSASVLKDGDVITIGRTVLRFRQR
jgi:hypothetical protein